MHFRVVFGPKFNSFFKLRLMNMELRITVTMSLSYAADRALHDDLQLICFIFLLLLWRHILARAIICHLYSLW